MTQSLAEFIHRENVANFVGRLLGVMNDEQRETITALLADDEPHLVAHLAQRLAALWPELRIAGTAANGLEALERIQDLRPHMAFLDIRMPGLSGCSAGASACSGGRRRPG